MGEEDKTDRGKGGKTTSGDVQAWSPASPRGHWRTGKKGENWLQNHMWCPYDPHGYGIDDDDDDDGQQGLWLYVARVTCLCGLYTDG